MSAPTGERRIDRGDAGLVSTHAPPAERKTLDEAPTERPRGMLRVATYNIHKGVIRDLFGLKRVASVHELRARLHELDADLIFLQEVQGKNDRHANRFEGQWPGEPQDVFLARSPTLKHTFETAYGRNASYLHGHHGNALLSRFPIVRRENRDFSDHALEKRGLLHCVVDVGGRPVHCFVVHFGLFGRSRERQAQALVDWIARDVPLGAPLIVAGDFNDWRDRLTNDLCAELGVCEVFDDLKARRDVAQRVAYYMHDKLSDLGVNVPKDSFRLPRAIRTARTFPALVPWFRMDRIYQRGFAVDHAEVLRGPSWARLSDHSPLVADLTPL